MGRKTRSGECRRVMVAFLKLLERPGEQLALVGGCYVCGRARE
jgi:hypothetical protein